MFEGTVSVVPSIWASVNSWFTPAVLFVLLNLCIATIAVTSGVGAARRPPKPTRNDNPRSHVARSPSLLHRLKSINFYAHTTPEPAAVPPPALAVSSAAEPTPVIETRFAPKPAEEEEEAVETIEHVEADAEEEDEQSMDEVFGMIQGQRGAMSRVKSDTRPAAGEIPVRLPRKMRKSASAKSAFAHFEADDAVESRRPSTVREGRPSEHLGGEAVDHEVDAKADDFINKFREQLKLQRIDSSTRYKEMLKRGAVTK